MKSLNIIQNFKVKLVTLLNDWREANTSPVSKKDSWHDFGISELLI